MIKLPVCHSTRTTGALPMTPPRWSLATPCVTNQNGPTFFLGSLHAPSTPPPVTTGPAGTLGQGDKIFHAPYLP